MSRASAYQRQEIPGQPVERVCDHPDCTCPGEFRAPRGRDRLDEYYWFCLEHVREYNKAWNFYRDMSEQEIERERRRDTVWRRPSWRFGAGPGRGANPRWDDPFGFTNGGGANGNGHADGAYSRRWPASSAEARALKVLELDDSVTPEILKLRYKTLAKRHHPDRNGGSKASEERLKSINEAYMTLSKALSS